MKATSQTKTPSIFVSKKGRKHGCANGQQQNTEERTIDSFTG
jgi:hypothetical protein